MPGFVTSATRRQTSRPIMPVRACPGGGPSAGRVSPTVKASRSQALPGGRAPADGEPGSSARRRQFD
jgi:hypothetical protein